MADNPQQAKPGFVRVYDKRTDEWFEIPWTEQRDPTPQEIDKLRQWDSPGREMARGLAQSSGPAGDVGRAASAIMDRGWSEALPTVGGFVGSLVGGKRTPAAIALSGLGGMAGEAGREAIQGTPLSGSNILKAGAIQAGGEALGRGLQGGLKSLGKGVYAGNLKASTALQREFPDAIDQLMKDRITITDRGLGRLNKGIEKSAQEAARIATKADNTPGIPPISGSDIAPAFNGFRATLARRAQGGTDTSSAETAVDEMIARLRQGQPLSVSEGVATKRAQQDIADRAWAAERRGAKTVSTDDELAQASAKGWRQATEARAPELRAVNKVTQNRVGGREMLENALARTANTSPVSMRDLIGMAGAGGVGYVAGSVPAAMTMYGAVRALTTPSTGSAIGNYMSRMGNVPISEVVRAAILASMGYNGLSEDNQQER